MNTWSIARGFAVTVVTGAVLFGLAWVSAAPVPLPQSAAARLRLSWNARPERIEVCRKLSAKELSEREEHMRLREECTGQFATYALRVESDGRTMHESVVRGGGFRNDRPMHVLQDIAMAPGEHRVRVTLERREKASSDSSTKKDEDEADADTGLFAGRAERERTERSRRARAAIPPSLVLDTTVAFSPGRVLVVSLPPERRRLQLIDALPP